MEATVTDAPGQAPAVAPPGRIQLPRLSWGRKPVDVAESQLKALEHQSSGIVQIAHTLAVLMIIGTSVASLVTLSGTVVNHLVANLTHSRNAQFTDAASVVISLLFVFVMDTASIYAATQVRVILERGLKKGALWVHGLVMILVSLLEGVTYAVMLWTYEPPQDFLHGALIIGRAASVPVLAIYLVLARITPAGSNDIVNLSGMASGAGLLRDVYEKSRDKTVSTARKAEIYKATQGALDDQTKLDNLINVLHTPDGVTADGSEVKVGDLVLKTDFATAMQGLVAEVTERLSEQMAAMQSVGEVAERLKAFSPTELEQRFQDWAERMAQQLNAQFAQAQDRLALMLAEQGDVDTRRAALSNSALPGTGDGPKVRPKPGTKAYKRWVREVISAIEAQGIMPTVAMLAERLKESEVSITPVFEEWEAERVARI